MDSSSTHESKGGNGAQAPRIDILPRPLHELTLYCDAHTGVVDSDAYEANEHRREECHPAPLNTKLRSESSGSGGLSTDVELPAQTSAHLTTSESAHSPPLGPTASNKRKLEEPSTACEALQPVHAADIAAEKAERKKDRAREAKRQRTKNKKARQREELSEASAAIRLSWSERHGTPDIIRTDVTAEQLGAADGIRKPVKSDVTTLAEGLSDGLRVVRWDGEHPVALVDKSDRVICLLAGRPVGCSDWEPCWQAAEQDICKAEQRISGASTSQNGDSDFSCFATGITHSGGQKSPGNLKHNTTDEEAISALKLSPSLCRMVKFAQVAMARYAPKLYVHYRDTLKTLTAHDPQLTPAFRSTIWPTASFDMGDHVIAHEHRTSGNLPQGWSALYSLGDFDPTRGGHLILRELGLMVESPPGSLILFPSSIITHGNTPIHEGERRKSFMLYAPGALFRWVNHGFRSKEAFVHNDAVGATRTQANRQTRWKEAVDMYSIVDELQANRVVCGLVQA